MGSVQLAGFVARRLVAAAVVVVLVTALAWWLLHAMRPELFPAEPAWPTQWREYLVGGFLHFDFGESRSAGTPEISWVLRQGLPADASLFVGGLATGLAGGLLLGAWAAHHRRGRVAGVLKGGALVLMCAPVYVVGLGLLLLLGDEIGLLGAPVGIPLKYVEFADAPAGWVGALVVPWMVLGAPIAGMIALLTAGGTREALEEDPVRTARAKGVSSRRALLGHALPLGAAPALGAVSASANLVVTNMVLTERVFQVPGVFLRLPAAVGSADVAMILALTMVGAAFVALTSIVLDVAIAVLDPRVSRPGR